MGFCSKCGKEIIDESKGCTFCEDMPDKGYSKGSYKEGYSNGGIEDTLSNGIKVFIVTMTVILPGLGYIIGLILAIVFIGKDNKDYQSFGKALLTLVIIFIVLTFICCLLYFVFGIALLDKVGSEYVDYMKDIPVIRGNGFI